MIGDRIAHYEILEQLGSGAMGVVYMARDTRLNRRVALKFLSADIRSDPVAHQRFVREAQAASALDHPNICTIYEIDETDDGQLFIAMAYYAGETLGQVLQRGPLPVERTVDLAVQLARGLRQAHAHGIVHRDIKPSNLMIAEDGKLKILDFGLAKVAASTEISQTGARAGTVAYMSPEQIRGEEVGFASDLWSVGVVLYEMLSGDRPFGGSSSEAVMYSILNRKPRPLGTLPAGAAERLGSIITRALAKKPRARYRNADQLLRDLDALASGFVRTATLPRGLPTAARWGARRRLVAYAALALVIAGAAYLGLERGGRVRPAAPADAPGILVVAVAAFENRTGDPELDWLRQGIPDMLIAALSRSSYLRVVGGGGKAGASASAGIPAWRPDPVGTGGSAADAVVGGSILQDAGTFRILGRTTDRAGRVVHSDAVEGSGVDSLLELGDTLAGRIRLALEIRASGDPTLRNDEVVRSTSSLEAYRHFVEARGLFSNRRHPEAIEHLQAATALDPCFARAWDLSAVVYLNLGDEGLARRALASAVSCPGRLDEIDTLGILRRQAQLDGKVDAELGYLKRLALLQPRNPHWHFVLGWHHWIHRRSCEHSIASYQTSLAIDPDGDPRYHYYLGDTYLACGRVEEALESYRRQLAARPEEAEAHRVMAYGLLTTGAYEAALESLQTALRLAPDYAEATRDLGDWKFQLGRLEEAHDHYREYLARALGGRQEADAHLLLAGVYLEQGRPEEAEASVNRALISRPDMPRALWLRGILRLRERDAAAARAALAELEAVVGRTESLYQAQWLHHLRGQVLLAAGRGRDAVRELEAARRLAFLDQAFFGHAVADALVATGDPEAAEAECKAVLELNPRHAPTHALLARIYQERGLTQEAIASYRRFLEIWRRADPGLDLPSRATAALRELEARDI